MITNIDDNVGLLMKKLDDWNLTDNTRLIFMSNNGTSGGLDVCNYGMKGKKGTRVFLCGNLSQRTEGH